MRTLVDFSFGFNHSVGVLIGGRIRICDGKTDLDVNGRIYTSDYLISHSSFNQTSTILHGGVLADFEDVSISIVDDNLLQAIENEGLSLTNGNVWVNVYDEDTLVRNAVWFGYIVDTELKENILTFKCQNLVKDLKVLELPQMYGKQNRLKLTKDSTIKSNSLQFNTSSGFWSDHPTIAEIGSPLVPSSGSYYGITRTNSTSTYIVTKSINNPFSTVPTTALEVDGVWTYYPDVPLRLTFLTGANSDRSYRIKHYTDTASGGFWYKKIYLKEDFDTVDIKAFDRCTISDSASYFPINNNCSWIDKVYAKIDSDYYNLSSATWKRTTINGVEYLVVYPTDNVYREIPITYCGINSVYEPGNGTEVATTQEVISGYAGTIFDNDFSSAYSYNFPTPDAITAVISRYSIEADLTQAKDKEIYLGLNINFSFGTHGNGDKGFQTHYQVTLKDGNKLTFSPWGLGLDTIASGPQVVCKIQTAPYGDITGPVTVNDNLYPPGDLAFDKSQFQRYKIDIPSEVYKDVSNITLQTRVYIGDGSGNPGGVTQSIYKMGLYVQETVNELDEIYIDTDGVKDSLDKLIGSNDGIAKDILTRLDAYLDSGFQFSDSAIVNYNHISAESSSKSAEVLDTLAREGLFVIATGEFNTVYAKPLIMHNDDSKLDLDIPSTDVISIKEPLKDVDKDDYFNLIRLAFKYPTTDEEFIEITNLDKAFPTLENVSGDSSNYCSVFTFSDNFMNLLKGTRTDASVYDWLKSFWQIAKNSYAKYGIANKGTIELQTIYIEDILSNLSTDSNTAANRILELVRTNANRRKTIEIIVPLKYGTQIPLKLGSRTRLFAPDVMQNNSLYGFLTSSSVIIDNDTAYTQLGFLVDSYKLTGGEIGFF